MPNEAGGNWQSGSGGALAPPRVPPPCENWGDVGDEFIPEFPTVIVWLGVIAVATIVVIFGVRRLGQPSGNSV